MNTLPAVPFRFLHPCVDPVWWSAYLVEGRQDCSNIINYNLCESIKMDLEYFKPVSIFGLLGINLDPVNDSVKGQKKISPVYRNQYDDSVKRSARPGSYPSI